MPGDVTTNVTAVVTVVDKTGTGTASINKNLAAIEETVKSINAHVATSLADIAKAAPGNIWNFPIHGDAIVPDLVTPVQIQAVKVSGVYERMRDELVDVGGAIKARLGGAFEEVFSIAKRVGGGIASVFTSFGGLFAAGFGIGTALDVVVGGMTDLVNTVDKLKPQADALGITVGHLQELTQWAKESGAPIDRVVSGFENLVRVSAGVDQGAKGYDRAAEAFAKLGVAVRDADTGAMKDVTALLPELAAGFQGIADPAERAKLAYDMFGQTWKLMLPLLMEGPEAIAKARETALAIGEVSDAQVEAAGKYKTALADWQATAQGLREQIGAELLPVVTPALKELTTFLQENKGEVVGGFKLGIEGLAEAFGQLDAVVKSTNADIQGIKATWEWLHKPITVPEWFGGPTATQAGGQVTSAGGGPLSVEDLAGSRGPILGAPMAGSVDVNVTLANAPPGSRATAATVGTNGRTTVDVGQSMPWSTPDYAGPWAPHP